MGIASSILLSAQILLLVTDSGDYWWNQTRAEHWNPHGYPSPTELAEFANSKCTDWAENFIDFSGAFTS